MSQTPRDEELWRLAKRRAGFQRNLAMFVIFGAMFWIIWWFTSGRYGANRRIPWPLWAMMGWGIALLLQYLNAYGGSRRDLEQREYEKLKNKENS